MDLLEDRNERMLAHYVGGHWRAPFSTRMAAVAGTLRVVLADDRDVARAWRSALDGQRAFARLGPQDHADQLRRGGVALSPEAEAPVSAPRLLAQPQDAEALLEAIHAALAARCAVVAVAFPACADALLERFHALTLVDWPSGALNLLYADAADIARFPPLSDGKGPGR